MLFSHTFAFLGAGNMARALIGGLLRDGHDGAETVAPASVRASRRTAALLDELAAAFPGLVVTTDNRAAAEGASVVVLASKPQGFADVVADVKDVVRDDALVVSILAGITTRQIEAAFGRPLAVVRTMPNTPALVDEGATALCGGRHATDAHLALATKLFEAVGTVEVLPEALMDAVTGLSGSGPAYIYMVVEALTDGGVKQGIPRPIAARLAAQTVLGAARLVVETGKHPAILRDEVTTPGGTAIAAVADLEAHGLRTMLINAVGTATARSAELARLREEAARR